MELNKIAAAILLAGLIGMITGKVSTILYYGGDPAAAQHGDGHHEVKRGYTIEGADAFAEGGGGATAKVEKKIANIAGFLHSADVASGESYFMKKCATCHTAEQGGKAKTGPNLYGILNRDKGSAAGFKYSKAMAEKEGNWGYDELNGFLYKPKKYIPGTIMAYAGTKKDQQRGDLIAYLRSLGKSSVALPPKPAPEAPAEEAAPAKAAH